MKVRVLSPHPDDAVWSLGGWIHHQRTVLHNEVEIVTVFNRLGSTDSARLQSADAWRQLELETMRATEDRKATRTLDAELLNLEFTDAAARTLSDGRWEICEPADLLAWQPTATQICARLTASFESLPAAELTLAPMGLGGHCDHVLVQRAAQTLWQETGTLRWYAEFPYALDAPPAARYRAEHVHVPWQPWLQAALCYRSQILRLYQRQRRFIDALMRYACVSGAQGDCVARIFDTASTYFVTDPEAASNIGSA